VSGEEREEAKRFERRRSSKMFIEHFEDRERSENKIERGKENRKKEKREVRR
jgi:hypothetical protein